MGPDNGFNLGDMTTIYGLYVSVPSFTVLSGYKVILSVNENLFVSHCPKRGQCYVVSISNAVLRIVTLSMIKL